MDEMRVLAATAILGYGFPDASFEAGLARGPHVIAADAGSSDPARTTWVPGNPSRTGRPSSATWSG
ncbi:hypothetical protein [Streptomyces sp. YGL11-2]|uniref:hypothetical protein n=1 Tax=Streptomyces sp. YGL11-2 TaxID=3414028 RepID=UPI003CED2A02